MALVISAARVNRVTVSTEIQWEWLLRATNQLRKLVVGTKHRTVLSGLTGLLRHKCRTLSTIFGNQSSQTWGFSNKSWRIWKLSRRRPKMTWPAWLSWGGRQKKLFSESKRKENSRKQGKKSKAKNQTETITLSFATQTVQRRRVTMNQEVQAESKIHSSAAA